MEERNRKKKESMETRIIEALRREGKPIAPETLLEEFEEKDQAAAAIERLLAEGRLILTRKKRLALPEQTGLIYGRIQGNARGSAFFIPEDGSEDLFIPAELMHGAMHGDKVWVRPTDNVSRSGRNEAEVMLAAVRAQTAVVGLFEADSAMGGGYVIPDDPRLYLDVLISPANVKNAKHGDKVVAKITRYADGRRPLAGEITEVIGAKSEAGTDILSIIRRLELPESFSKGAMRQARQLNKPVNADTAALREDLRGRLVITIDGADAKDLDDAVSLTKLSDGFLLGVHIADVSEYVQQGTLLDQEAYKRGTSVYFPDRVLPMFPQDVSNGVCSLNEKEDKLTLSCIMRLDEAGKVLSHRIAETVIRTTHRMTYEDVNAMFDGDEALRTQYADVWPMLGEMRQLMGKLNENRMKRGSIDFDLDEAEIVLDDKGRAVDVKCAVRGTANRMIEEFMLLANETVAKHAAAMGIPFVYRVHETPDKTKLADLNTFLNTLGYGVKNLTSVKPAAFQRILLKVKGTKDEALVSRVTLRAMKKARYAAENLGHFGLAADYYCHFTSPIRRYPDLTAHRMLKALLHGELESAKVERLREQMPEIAAHCSEREIAAMEAERAADDLKKCEFMQTKIGCVENGVISGVAQYGFFVRLSNTVEGMVRAAAIPGDYYVCDEKNYRITGKSSGRSFRVGDMVRVKVDAVDLTACTIDFRLATGTRNENTGKQQEKKPEAGPPAPKEEKRSPQRRRRVAQKKKKV